MPTLATVLAERAISYDRKFYVSVYITKNQINVDMLKCKDSTQRNRKRSAFSVECKVPLRRTSSRKLVRKKNVTKLQKVRCRNNVKRKNAQQNDVTIISEIAWISCIVKRK